MFPYVARHYIDPEHVHLQCNSKRLPCPACEAGHAPTQKENGMNLTVKSATLGQLCTSIDSMDDYDVERLFEAACRVMAHRERIGAKVSSRNPRISPQDFRSVAGTVFQEVPQPYTAARVRRLNEWRLHRGMPMLKEDEIQRRQTVENRVRTEVEAGDAAAAQRRRAKEALDILEAKRLTDQLVSDKPLLKEAFSTEFKGETLYIKNPCAEIPLPDEHALKATSSFDGIIARNQATKAMMPQSRAAGLAEIRKLSTDELAKGLEDLPTCGCVCGARAVARDYPHADYCPLHVKP